MSSSSCPAQAFAYNNGTECFCNPGFYLSKNATTNATSCQQFSGGGFGDWQVGSGVSTKKHNQSLVLLAPVLSFGDVVRRLTSSQAVLLEVTAGVLLAWLIFCAVVRVGSRGWKRWFGARFWISRFDCVFDRHHWANDQQVVKKRKTELGGTCSMAAVILFLGLLSALLYQVFTNHNIEVHKVKPANAPDLLAFVNDIEFHITTISSMTCSNLVPPSIVVVGIPGFIDYRTYPLSTYITYNCQNTSQGPAVTLTCNSCQIPRRDHYVSWQFVDLPNNPAAAVGFQFNLTAKQSGDDEHISFLSGTIKSENPTDVKPKTFRGADPSVLMIRLFPQTYNNLHNLNLFQPLLQDYVAGSSFSNVSGLQASLQDPKDGLVNTTLFISYLSNFIVEIDNENVLGPVSTLASIGGLYAFSLGIFLCLMAQCEGRIRALRDEDTRMLNTLSRRRAQRNWAKLRKFVMYTWGPSNLDPNGQSDKSSGKSTTDSLYGTLHKRRKASGIAASNQEKTDRVRNETNASGSGKSALQDTSIDIERTSSHPETKHDVIDIEGLEHSQQSSSSQPQ